MIFLNPGPPFPLPLSILFPPPTPGPGSRVTVVRSRVESAPLPPRCADVLVSEPMGTLLLNERMVESYVYARDKLLKPGGRMFPVSQKRGQCVEREGHAVF